MRLYEILGVEPDAPQGKIKQAFRSLAQQHHPDKGGDPARMVEIQKAYDVLGDIAKRARYDATGDEVQPATAYEQAKMGLAAIVLETLDRIEDGAHLLEHVAQVVQAHINQGTANSDAAALKMGKRQRALRRLYMLNNGQENLMASYLQLDIERLTKFQAHVAETMAIFSAMLVILADYAYAPPTFDDIFGGSQWQITS